MDPIKHDPDEMDDDNLSLIADEDEYEDTGELEMPKQMPIAWMVQVPKEIYTDWSKDEGEEPVQLGVMRRFTNGPRAGKTFILLNRTQSINSKLPIEYEMRVDEKPTGNTFLFSEKDVQNQPRRTYVKKDPLSAQGENRVKKYEPGQRKPWQSRTIAKQTKLAAAATKEASWVAVENADCKRIMAQRIASEFNNKTTIEILTGDVRQYSGNVLKSKGKVTSRQSNLQRGAGFDTFVKTAPVVPKAQQNKATRMPKNELLDILFEKFAKYRYWSLKALKGEINQPEEYLRTTANEIGIYIQSGPFNGHYKLRDDYERSKGIGIDAVAPKNEDYRSSVDTDGEVEDGVGMEGVVLNPS